MLWDPKVGCLTYKVKISDKVNFSKGDVLSEIARLYDSLGLIGPIVTKAKIFIQELWKIKLDWSEQLPPDAMEEWMNFYQNYRITTLFAGGKCNFTKYKIGYLVTGTLSQSQQQANCCLISAPSLDITVKKFFELESLPDDSKEITKSEEEIYCEEHFVSTYKRDNTGRFIVRLPIKENAETLLGYSKENAIKRLNGHMDEIKNETLGKINYYIPRHSVYKPEKTSTPLRIVFDASVKTSGFSLRSILLNGELLKDLSASSYVFDKEFQDAPVKTLGMLWDPKVGCLTYKVKISDKVNFSKGDVLSEIARLYDSLGLIGPIVTKAKIFIQELWKIKLDWSEQLPPDAMEEWMNFYQKIIEFTGTLPQSQQQANCCLISAPSLDITVKKFFELESLPDDSKEITKSEEEIYCEEHFVSTYKRDNTGRFIVRLPIKENAETLLGYSKENAIKRLNGHMEEIKNETLGKINYYIPRHSVYKPEKTSTPLRIVFDASAKTSGFL
ncbi:integrase catalytic domain-containing protein [Trichonephila clavipes]|uniref:Integrase catalytic domain-containing protein n=1 Tax=Trichonephila clavipes TaxID=2585209 RepID=A0A8X6RZ20_TRICX|nr:integrase catalytic domain-containing protein [Trichonephila clavipes]